LRTWENAGVLTIEVASRPEASDILSSPDRCADVCYLLSIGDGQDKLPVGYENVPHRMRLLMADVVTEFGATEHDIRKILRLAEQLRSGTGKILIHCEAGVSRSSAAALIMYACWLGPGREREAMTRVLAQRPMAVPNRRMVELADKLLTRGGALVNVLVDEIETPELFEERTGSPAPRCYRCNTRYTATVSCRCGGRASLPRWEL
jgi:predicted protein tyrosine phosphatase